MDDSVNRVAQFGWKCRLGECYSNVACLLAYCLQGMDLKSVDVVVSCLAAESASPDDQPY